MSNGTVVAFKAEDDENERPMTNRGRPRTPTAVLRMRGTHKSVQNAKPRAGEPEVDIPVGDPPPHLNANEVACWMEVVSLCPVGVLVNVDRLILEQTACLLAYCRKNKWNIPASYHSRFSQLLGLLGMTPADRSRVKVRKRGAQTSNPYED